MSNNIITIPKALARSGNLVLIPQKEYEEFLELKKVIRVFEPTKTELKALERGKREIREGKYILWHELKHKLAYNNQQRRRKKS